MGATKATDRGRNRRATYKCAPCKRTFPSAITLNAHNHTKHKKDKIVKAAKAPQSRSNAKLSCPTCKRSFTSQPNLLKHYRKCNSSQSGNQKVGKQKDEKTEVACCLCSLKFNTVKELNNHVDNDHFSSDEIANGQINPKLECAGCQREYDTHEQIDLHVLEFHKESLISMHFSDLNELIAWKAETEFKTKVFFPMKTKYQEKNFFRCQEKADIKSGKDSSVSVCPATIVTETVKNGIDMQFYKTHYGHKYTNYDADDENKTIPQKTIAKGKKIRKQKGAEINRESPALKVETSEEILYKEFVTLINSIINDSKKTTIDNLQNLHKKALEMQKILKDEIELETNLVEPVENKIVERNEVSTLRVYKNKRKMEAKVDTVENEPAQKIQKVSGPPTRRSSRRSDSKATETPGKHPRMDEIIEDTERENESPKAEIDTHSPKIINTFTLNENDDIDEMLTKMDLLVENTDSIEQQNVISSIKIKESDDIKTDSSDSTKSDGKENDILKKPKYEDLIKTLSFNDSYKDFITQHGSSNLSRKPKPSDNQNITESKLTDRNINLINGTPKKRKNRKVIDQQDVDQICELLNSPKKDPKVTSPKAERKRVNSDRVKTKLGQFKPISPSNKSPKQKKTWSPPMSHGNRPIFGKIKIDKYEVREQENDCNILILKI